MAESEGQPGKVSQKKKECVFASERSKIKKPYEFYNLPGKGRGYLKKIVQMQADGVICEACNGNLRFSKAFPLGFQIHPPYECKKLKGNS